MLGRQFTMFNPHTTLKVKLLSTAPILEKTIPILTIKQSFKEFFFCRIIKLVST
jgi:hypothetical protein